MTRARDLADLASSGVIEGTEVADDAITYAKIQNVAADERILGRVSGADGVIEELTKAQMLTMMNVADGSNAYTHPNHSGEVTSTNDGATVIADDIVDEANLKISNAGSNDQFLQKQSGNTGGLTWAAAGGGKVLQTKFSQSASSISISTSGAAVDIATLSFTPTSSTSQMMITICGVFYKQNNNSGNSKFNVLRDSTQCDQENWSSSGGSYLYYSGSTPKEHIGPLTYVVFDKPLSTTTVTYKFQASNTGSNTVSFYSGAKIIVTEVEA